MDKADLIEVNLVEWGRGVLRMIGKRMKKIAETSKDDLRRVSSSASAYEILAAAQKQLDSVTVRNVRLTGEYARETVAAAYDKMRDLYAWRGIKSAIKGEAFANDFALKSAREMVNLSQTKLMGIYDPVGRRVLTLRTAMTEAFDAAASSVVEGGDFQTAVRQAVRVLGGSGMRVIYPGVTRRLDTVVRQNVLYEAKQAAQAYSYQLGAELGCDGIEIDWHADSRPSHEFMQGKQYAIHGGVEAYGQWFPGADDEGVYDALEDYGCRHFATPIILGISEPAFSPGQLEELNAQNNEKIAIDGIPGEPRTGYEWSQAMRALEAETRRQKDEEALAEGAGDWEAVRECRMRVEVMREKYERISSGAGIKEDLARMVAYR